MKKSFFVLNRRGLYLFAVITALVCLTTVQTYAQGSGNKYSGEFLAIGVGGRPLGMGGAFVSLVNDVTAGYWNPGALSRLNYPQASLGAKSLAWCKCYPPWR